MSVIGPRPGLWNQDILTAERDKYGANDVKPGLTGWAQINGRDELEIPDKAKLDGDYVQNMGLKMDPFIDCVLFSYVKEFANNSVPMHVLDNTEHFSKKEAEDKVYRRLFGLSDDELSHDDNIRMIDHNEFFYRAAGRIVSCLDTKCYVIHYHNWFDRHYQKYRSDYQKDLEYIWMKRNVKK